MRIEDDRSMLIPVSSFMQDKKGPNEAVKQISASQLNAVLAHEHKDLNDIKTIMEVLPDLQYAKRVKVASVLSPKDLGKPTLNIKIDHKKLKGKVKSTLAQRIEEHFRTDYPLEKQLPKILGETLFDYGAYAVLLLPPNKLDELIWQSQDKFSMESIDAAIGEDVIGIIGPTTVVQKSDYNKLGVELITDNTNHFRRSLALELQRVNTINDLYGLESTYVDQAFKVRESIDISYIEPDKRENGNPIVFKLPPGSVVPVYDPSDPSVHVGYYIAIDSVSGTPISRVGDANVVETLEARLKSIKGGGGEQMINMITGMGFSIDSKRSSKDYIEAYSRKLEAELTRNLEGGIYRGSFKVARAEEVYRLMFAKALAKQKTKMIFVPSDLVSYTAFEYNSLGMGVSLLEKTKLYSSLRAMVMFASLMANIKNNVGRTVIDITLDAEDPDQVGTVETILHGFANLEKAQLPVGPVNPSDIIQSLHRSKYQVRVDGGDTFPGTKTDITDSQRQVVRIDSELMDMLADAQYAGINIPRALIDAAMSSDFAIQIQTSNILWQRTNMEDQEAFVGHLCVFIKKYVRLSAKLRKIIAEEAPQNTIEDVLAALGLSFPKADFAMIEGKSEAFDDYSTFVDNVVETMVSEEAMLDYMEESDNLAAVLDNTRVTIANAIKREWLISENIIPEVTNIFEDENGEKDLAKRITEHNNKVINVMGDLIKGIIKQVSKTDAKIEAARAKSANGEADTNNEEESPQVAPATPDDGDFDTQSEDGEEGADATTEEDTEVVEEDTAPDEKEAT